MQDFPHRYKVAATSTETGDVALSSESVSDIASAAPKEFGGQGINGRQRPCWSRLLPIVLF
jgi:hypothetical protein